MTTQATTQTTLQAWIKEMKEALARLEARDDLDEQEIYNRDTLRGAIPNAYALAEEMGATPAELVVRTSIPAEDVIAAGDR